MNTSYKSEIPSEEWVQDRKNYIGGSEVAAILEEDPHKTPLQVYIRKKGLVQPVESTAIMEFGQIFEPVMAEYFEDVTGLKTRRVNKPFIHEEHDFLRANIDRQILNGEGIDGTSLLELKTTTSHRLKSLDYQYPRKWYFQIQHYLGITGYNQAFLFIYERDTAEFHEQPILIERDQKFITENMKQLIAWWNTHIVKGKRPDPINGEDILMLYPDSSDGKVIEATRDSFECYEELTRLRDRKSDLERREEYLQNKLKEEIGDAERLVLGGRTLVSWKSYSRQRLDSKKLQKEKPDIYSKYLTETSYRRFSIK